MQAQQPALHVSSVNFLTEGVEPGLEKTRWFSEKVKVFRFLLFKGFWVLRSFLGFSVQRKVNRTQNYDPRRTSHTLFSLSHRFLSIITKLTKLWHGSKFRVASRGSPCNSTAFLSTIRTGNCWTGFCHCHTKFCQKQLVPFCSDGASDMMGKHQ